VIQLETAYLGELLVINSDLLIITRRHDPKAKINRALSGQIRNSGGTPEKLNDPTRSIYKDREAVGRRYIDMLRDILSPDIFLELEGARRWVPRDEQPYDNLSKPSRPLVGPDGGLSIQGGGSGKSGKGEKGQSKPNPAGISNPKGGSGSGAKGGR